MIPPKFVFPLVLEACPKVIQGKPFDGTNGQSAAGRFLEEGWRLRRGRATRDRLLADARKALTDSVKPAYEKLIASGEAGQEANDDAGVWKFPDGADFYESALRRTTTTKLTADEIHEIGLKEVARIHGEMRKIMEKVGFKGDLQAFFKFMREDPQFYLPRNEQGARNISPGRPRSSTTMKKRLDELFITKPKADIVVKAVEKFPESSAGKAFYNQPAPDGSRPGMFYVNLREHEGQSHLRIGGARAS